MFRLRLAVIIILSFGFVLITGIAFFWFAHQISRNSQSSLKAFEIFDQYQRVSREAYRHFKYRTDQLNGITPSEETPAISSNVGVNDAMQKLKNIVVTPPNWKPKDKHESDKRNDELHRVALLAAFLDASEYHFDEIERMFQQNQSQLAAQMLSQFSKDEIDGKFQPMIDEAIAVEREKVKNSRRNIKALISQTTWIIIFISSAAAIFSVSAGLFLLGGFTKRMQALLKGTDEVASGHLDYRIAIDAHDEFADLAGHFNQMAQELDLQQKKLRQGRAVLEQRVADRTFELNVLNSELRRMDGERRDFLADISHELRTPITVIRGEAEVTLRGPDRSVKEYKDALHRVLELSMQLGKYVQDLLFLARIETASLQFEWERINLAELVLEAEENFQVMAEENEMSMSVTGPDEAVWVRGDKQRLKQILFILVDNACCYSKPGSQIAIDFKVVEKEAQIRVTDQGIGIPTEDLERIFDRHFRSSNARRLRDDGRGLGLSLARSILKAHDGEITVTSVEHSGSTFTVRLPVLSNHQEPLSV